jgi:hypothetical protein
MYYTHLICFIQSDVEGYVYNSTCNGSFTAKAEKCEEIRPGPFLLLATECYIFVFIIKKQVSIVYLSKKKLFFIGY